MPDEVRAELSSHHVTQALTQASQALSQAASGSLMGLSDAAVTAGTALAYRVEAQLQSLILQLVGEAAARPDACAVRGASGPAAWVSGRVGVDPGRARGDVALAEALGARLSETWRAFASGEITRDHARAIRDIVEGFPDQATDEHVSRAEAKLLDVARRRDSRALRSTGRTVLEDIDPELYDAVLQRQVERDEAVAFQLRDFTLRPVGDGRTRVLGCLTEPVAQALTAALDPLAAPLPSTAEGPDTRSAGQRRHDGLGELVRRYQVAGKAPVHGGNGTEVVIRVTDGVLFRDSPTTADGAVGAATVGGAVGAATVGGAAGGAAAGDAVAGAPGGAAIPPSDDQLGFGWQHARYLRDGTPLSRPALEQALCDAKVTWIRYDSDFTAFWASANPARLFTGPLRRALELRDGGCSFPGCDRPVAWTEGHHIVPWSQGGATVLSNGVLFCGSHHRAVHHTGWRVAMADDGLPVLYAPAELDPDQLPQRHARHHPTSPDNPHGGAARGPVRTGTRAADQTGTAGSGWGPTRRGSGGRRGSGDRRDAKDQDDHP